MSTMKRPFAVGDRVAAYDCGNSRTSGRIDNIDKDGDLEVKGRYYHPKACRRLKPARKATGREFWIIVPQNPTHVFNVTTVKPETTLRIGGLHVADMQYDSGWYPIKEVIHVREVLQRNKS